MSTIFKQFTKAEQKYLDSNATGELAARSIEDSRIAFENFFAPIAVIADVILVIGSYFISLVILN
jgi:hypothetical protein